MHRLVPLLAILALSCGNTARPDFVVHLVDSQGANPFATSCPNGMIAVDVRQGTHEILTSRSSITAGSLGALSVEIPSYGLLTQIAVTVSCTDSATTPMLIGATPQFLPVGYGFVDIVLGQPGHCDQLSAPTLVPARVGPQLVTLGANVVVVGGLDATGNTTAPLQSLDPISLTYTGAAAQFFDPPLTVGSGRGRAVAIDDTRIVIVSDALRVIYDASPTATTHQSSLTLHAGAGAESAVVELGGNGVAVIGGFDGDAVTGVTWIATDGTTSSGALMFPRRRPSAAWVNGRLLVVGGQAAGAPLFELMTLRDSVSSAQFGDAEERYAPLVTTNASRSQVFVALGSDAPDADTTLRTTSYVLSSCNNAGCSVAGGPDLTELPAGAALVSHEVGTLGSMATGYETLVVGGTDTLTGTPSMLIDRVRFETDGSGTNGVSVTPFGELHTPRSLPGATEIGAGVILVAGGADAGGDALNTVEICFPAALRPI